MHFATLKRDTLIYTLSSLLVRGQQILLIPIYTRYLGSDDYGVIEIVAIVGALVNLLVAFEIGQGMARYVADAPDEHSSRRYARTAITFGTTCYLLFWLLIAAISPSVTSYLFDGRAGVEVLLIAVAAIALNGVYMLLQDLLRWRLRPMAYFAASMAYTFGGVSAGVWLVASMNIGVSGVFWGQLVGAMFGFVVAIRAAGEFVGIGWDRLALARMLRFSLPLVVSSVAIFANTYTDRLVIREMLGLEALGIYSVAARFSSTIAILTVGLQAALSPLVYRTWREPGAPGRLARIFRIYSVAMIPLIGVLSLFAKEIIGLVAGPDFQDAGLVLPPLAMTSMLLSLYIFVPGLFLGERTGIAAAVSIFGAFANFMLCLWLIDVVGLLGAALSAAIAAVSVFAGHAIFGRRYFNVEFDKLSLAVTGSILILLVSLGVVVFYYHSETKAIFFGVKVGGLLLASVVLWRYGLTVADRSALFATLSRFGLVK